MGKNQNRKYVEKYGLPADLLDNMLNPSEDAWSPKIALKIQEEIGVVKKKITAWQFLLYSQA